MRRYGNIYEQICDYENIYNAYLQARKCKRYRGEVLKFTANLEENLINIQNELIWKTYQPRAVRQFYVTEPKRRLITAPAFYDRVVHHALHNIIEPIFDKAFIYHSYACRNNKGTHAAVDYFQKTLSSMQKKHGRVYCLKLDVAKYFPSINHDILYNLISHKIKDPDALWLIRVIIDGNPTDTGLGIGALTSQLFANIYLDHLDHYAKEVLRIKNYIRYMDDIVILHASKGYLHNIRKEIEDFLWQELRLKTNGKTQVMAVNRGITFLGFRIWPTHRLLKSQAKRRIKRKLRLFAKLYKEKRIGLDEINASIQSWLGHLKHCDSYRLREKLFEGFVLSR